MKSKHLTYSKRPYTPITALLALWGRSRYFDPTDIFPVITAEQRYEGLDRRHLGSFEAICTLEKKAALSPIYPLTLAYPLLQRILCQKAAPLSMYVVLNSRIQILQLQPLEKGEPFYLRCVLNGFCVVPKGLEVYIYTTVESRRGLIWENIQTYFYRGQFGAVSPTPEQPGYEDLSEKVSAASWLLPKGVGFKFSKISGDGNPIHWADFWARWMGFQRAFAQPLLVLGTAIDRLTRETDPVPLYLDVALKGPVFYGRDAMVKTQSADKATRFDVLSQGNPRPCMRGILELVPHKDRLSSIINTN
jgi:hypothetical protein